MRLFELLHAAGSVEAFHTMLFSMAHDTPAERRSIRLAQRLCQAIKFMPCEIAVPLPCDLLGIGSQGLD